MQTDQVAQAIDFTTNTVYTPAVRPGYTGWANLFQFGNGDLGIAFNEIRKEKNPDFQPPSLEYVEAWGLPYSFVNVVEPQANHDLVSEYVHMISTDNGQAWEQTGRCSVRKRHYWYTGFPDGRMVRLYSSTGFQNPYEDTTCINVEESRDGGNSWKLISSFLRGYYTNMFKFRKLSDGRLVAAGPIVPSWGPGGKTSIRRTTAPGQIQPCENAFFVSEDDGYTWTGPHYVFGGITALEFDFVELPSGNLLFINSTIQAGQPVRQIVRRTATGYVNDPLMSINKGTPDNEQDWVRCINSIVPETVVCTQDGLLVGALRGKKYACSKDLGENWYEIEDAPISSYQPMSDILPDGRIMTVWHHGADSSFGEYDMYIGVHSFKVDTTGVPEPTRIEIEHDLSEDGNQYLNAFTVKLTSNGKPVRNKKIELCVKHHYDRNSGLVNPQDINESDDIRVAVTSENGLARFALTDMDEIPDIHMGYIVMPRFIPESGDSCEACCGTKYCAYPLTPVRNCNDSHPVFMDKGNILITRKTAETFPDLAEVISKIDPDKWETTLDEWIKAAGNKKWASEILKLLITHHVIKDEANGIYHWYRRSVIGGNCGGGKIINEVCVSENGDYCV